MEKVYNIKNQKEAIIYFITQMDIEMIDAFLDPEKTFQDMEKEKFISSLNLLFQAFKEEGDTFLNSYAGRCNTCYKDKTGFTFVGNKSHNYVSIVFDSKAGIIDDMFECSDFLNDNKGLFLGKKIYIDQLKNE